MIGGRNPHGVSICIPNWNHRNYLGRSIGSALRAAEALKDRGVGCQVIVVDDFSRDGSQRLLASMALADRLGVLDPILATSNEGLAATRNRAMHHARYRHVCFMDADNELVPDNLYHFWRAARDTGAAITYGNLVMHNGERSIGLLSNDFVDERIYDMNYIDAFSLVDADQVEELGGYYGKHAAAHEDWELLLHLCAEDRLLVFVPMVLGYYHVAPLSMIQTTAFDHSKMRRVYAQRKSGLPLGFDGRRIYHPDIGWL
ncbi:glycosyltransferase [Ancylobacter sp. Lp-2]|uniref:glycosyltransferase family 2 protein n=1 Tax=Ancylobacter sp. Lp-2 TaxID=2881339 RepID=UPI001E62D0D9|nr:glycosyltransferase [Ancylobacter sp. Lp-2]MCB4769216.1 glycosyltransferase [Ancylobacter sp. Lp-2]